MKALGLITILFFTTPCFAMSGMGLSRFNKAMIVNIDLVIKDNPEVYETKGRAPASVRKSPEKTPEKLDEFEEQVHGAQSW